MRDEAKRAVERWAGDRFIAWLNLRDSTNYTFAAHPDPPYPDLLYRDGDNAIYIETTEITYDQDAAKFEGMNRRGRVDAPTEWGSLKPTGEVVPIDHGFVDFVNQRLLEKSKKTYPCRPTLVLHHICRLVGSEGLDRYLARVAIPETHPFLGIYCVADLPRGEKERQYVRVLEEK